MIPLLLMSFFLTATMPAHSADILKKQASEALKIFFQVTEPITEFRGRYVDTPPEYGEACRVRLDFSEPGKESFTIRGAYTPSTSIGDGIYFDAPDDTVVTVTAEDDTMIIEQRLRDGFSTGTHTLIRLHKHPGMIMVTIKESSRLLLLSTTQVKHCAIPLE